MRLIVTGGGTGGHIYPALAIADKYKEKYESIEILYVGVNGGLESQIVPKYGYQFKGIDVKGFQRKINLENFRRIVLALKALKEANKIIKNFKPELVIGTGGYVCGPVVMAAQKMGIKTAIHEQNAFPGITNKILAKKVDRVFLGFEAASNRLVCKNPPIVVGNPVRKEISNPKTREQARIDLGLPMDKKFILVTGGSGGFDRINDTFETIIPELQKEGIGFVFATGKRYFEKVRESTSNIQYAKNQIVSEYIENMPDYLAACDLCIVSAGATTIAEIIAIGRASIIIPKAYTAENHQEYNARFISEKSAGFHILEKELTKEIMMEKIIEILQNNQLRISMEKNSRKLGEGDPCEKIFEEMSRN